MTPSFAHLALAAAALGTIAAPAFAQDAEPRFCPNRPGLGSSTCSTEAGRLGFELGVAGWTIDKTGGARSDSVSVGDTFLRYGIDDRTEVQLGFIAYTHNYSRSGGVVRKDGGFSDVRIGVRHNLIGNDDGDVALAIEPYATVPVGGSSASAGDWSAGVVIPSSFSLAPSLSFAATAIAAAAVDSDGDGRHLAAAQYVGLSQALTETVGITGELGIVYDDDPAGDLWAPVASVSFDWTPRERLQLDAGTVVGLDDDSPDLQLYIGLSTLF